MSGMVANSSCLKKGSYYCYWCYSCRFHDNKLSLHAIFMFSNISLDLLECIQIGAISKGIE